MQVIQSNDGKVSKYIHADGSETCIKTVNSVETINGATISVDKRKYSVIISASAGCPMACTFCSLTIAKTPYVKLTYAQIINNVKDAILNKSQDTDLSDKYIKICWMGMGEALLTPLLVHACSIELLDWVLENNLAVGLDCVDIGTVLPKIPSYWENEIMELNHQLHKYSINPFRMKHHSHCRIFYSLHAATQDRRNELIPNATKLSNTMGALSELQSNGITIVFHYILLDGINDSVHDIGSLICAMYAFYAPDGNYTELRILRYNQHPDSDIKESERFDELVEILQSALPNVKLQTSYGDEVQSACGQFMCTVD